MVASGLKYFFGQINNNHSQDLDNSPQSEEIEKARAAEQLIENKLE